MQRSHVPLPTTFVLLTPHVRTMTVIDKSQYVCNYVNKTITSVEYLHYLIFYVTCKKEVTLAYELSQRLDLKHSRKSGMDITPLRIHSNLINSFNKIIFIRFHNELKFHIFT